MEAGQKLLSLVPRKSVSDYPTITPLLDLQRILGTDTSSPQQTVSPDLGEALPWDLQNLQEEAIWDVDISPDGKTHSHLGLG